MRRLQQVACLGALAASTIVAACSGDDDTSSPTSASAPPVTSSPDSVVTTPPSSASTTPETDAPTTTAAPTTTQSIEAFQAEVAAAFLELDAKSFALFEDPRLDGLEAAVAEIAVPGSPYYTAAVSRLTELANNGEYIARNQPDLKSLTVELVEIVGPTRAKLTFCQVTNAVTMKRADRSPTGRPFPVGGTGQLVASRSTQSLVKTADGWRHEDLGDPNDPYWEGIDACPPE